MLCLAQEVPIQRYDSVVYFFTMCLHTSHFPPFLNLSQCQEPHFDAMEVGLRIGARVMGFGGFGVRIIGLRGAIKLSLA